MKTRVEKLCQAFENGKELVELSQASPHDISNVLKLYLRQVRQARVEGAWPEWSKGGALTWGWGGVGACCGWAPVCLGRDGMSDGRESHSMLIGLGRQLRSLHGVAMSNGGAKAVWDQPLGLARTSKGLRQGWGGLKHCSVGGPSVVGVVIAGQELCL